MFSPFLGCSGAENAEHATNQISASPPPPSQNENFMLLVKSPSSSPPKSYKSELIG